MRSSELHQLIALDADLYELSCKLRRLIQAPGDDETAWSIAEMHALRRYHRACIAGRASSR